MSDSAKGPAAGYIFQFEIALLELLNLSSDEAISIEKVDDIAIEDNKSTYIFTIQAKHSISTGSNFGSTSEDLWKTFKIWITKLNNGILNSSNKYKAVTNKKIPSSSIIKSFGKVPFDDLIKKVESVKMNQEAKLLQKQAASKNTAGTKKIIDLIDFCLLHKKEFQTIVDNLEITEEFKVKDLFINQVFLASAPDIIKDNMYQGLLGWLFDKSKEYWIDKKEAIFKRSDF